jgi:hypothetical protein
MIQLTDADFRALENFELKWRWTDSKWAQLPETALSQIRPFVTEKARALSTLARRTQHFEHVSDLDAKGDIQEIRNGLRRYVNDPELSVIVSWDAELAVLVSWSVFCDYWNDFCYPASDDIFVYPLSEEWILFWHHDEIFSFARQKINHPKF